MFRKIITLANYKGGVSKTTSTASIGACLAMKGKKVLLIDLVPMTPELLPLKGMRMLDNFVLSLQRIKPSLKLSGVFIARYNNRKLNKVVEQAVKDRYSSIIMNTRIRENIALAESAGSGMSIFEYDPQSNGAADYLALTEEILSRNS